MLKNSWLKSFKTPRERVSTGHSHRRKAYRPVLETLEDRLAPATFTVLNTNDSGAGSLRQAILNANITTVRDLIAFNIAGAGVHTIAPTTALPPIEQPVIIDGYTQPGSSPNTNGPGLGNNAVLRIELNGSGAGPSANGLDFSLFFNTESCIVRGLAINRFGSTLGGGAGVTIGGRSTLVLVQGNLIGTDATGTLARGNGGSGVDVGGSGNTIGGPAPAMRNLISANGGGGITFGNNGGSGAGGNLVQNNFIGTDTTGSVALGNQNGIVVGSGHNNRIGGPTAVERNVISGNTFDGIQLTDSGQGTGNGNVVRGNYIGTGADGVGPLGNGRDGVSVDFGGSSNTIGGAASGAGNVIAFNAGFGVNLSRTSGVGILGNSIFANGRLGITLGGATPTANDPGDADTGPNNLQNFPVLSDVIGTAAGSIVFGSLNSTLRTEFLLQFFASATADPSGHGEGQTFLGELVVRTDSGGNVPFAATFPVRVSPGHHVTATATRLNDHDANPNTPAVPTDTSEFSRAVNEAVSVLELGQTVTRDIALGEEVRFRLNVPPGTDARLSATFPNPQIGEIFVLMGEVPDPNQFSLHAIGFVNPNPTYLLPGSPASYLILVRGTSTAAIPSGTFTLGAAVLGLEIDNVAPNRGSNAGRVTATIAGAGFTPATVFTLMASDGTERPAVTIVQQSDTTFFATFDLVGLVPGTYDLRAVDGARSTVASGAFTVTAGPVGRVSARLVSPSRLRAFTDGLLVVEYANDGETDIAAPLLIVRAAKAVVEHGSDFNPGRGLPPQSPPPSKPVVQFLAISQSGPAGVLPPGARGRFEFRFRDDGSLTPAFNPVITFELSGATAAEGESAYLASHKDLLRPATVDPQAWDIIFNNLLTRVGTTVGDYVTALGEAANYLSRYAIYTGDIGRLVSLFVQQADGALPGQGPSAAVDAAAPASGRPLVWGRSFASTISRRFELGILGRGWSHPWESRLLREPGSSDVQIRTPGGTRRFTQEPDGSFRGTFSDPGQLSLRGNGFVLRETNGVISRFDATTGQLLDVEDRNGNRVTLNTTSGNLTSLVHSNGDQFTLSYNAQGRLSQLLDQAGRATTFEYDAAGEHLLRVTGPAGTTAYTYDTVDGSPREHALKSVTLRNGTQVFYDYEAQGRLARVARGGGAEAVTFSYGSVGEFFVTDASGATRSLYFNEVGQVLETRDPLGRSARLDYDLDHRPDRLTLPLDAISLFNFDSDGNPTSVVKPDGRSINSSYNTAFSVPSLIRDERFIPLQYNYDAEGNPTSIVHADGSAERFNFDADGNVTRTINRRGQAITYTYDARGQLVRKDHADGSNETFTYDDRGNLLTATDARGTTTSGYDGADRLTNVTYPNGRSLQYTYDAGGRRTRLEDHDGFTVNYTYDAAGRLDRLTDGSGALIVSYDYDTLGRLAREDNGNGTFTTYTYDAAGQLTSLVNHMPDASVNSRFDYAFDALGRRTSVSTLEGLTTFGYDALGQLTAVALPGGRTLLYEYDAAGNRVAVIDGGVRTDYKTNNLNQYTRVGSGARTYDADGNLLGEVLAGATYNYDDEDRLVAFTDASSTVQYEYDSLGNRIAKVEGGVRTEYLPDPTGLVNVVAEYDPSGNVIARYVHGFGLVSRHDAGGSAAFYDYDAAGSTAALTGSDGSAVNRYSYLPFGEPLTHSETVPNPFEYVGQFGVQRDSTGLDYMRARYYAAPDGRFISEDPIGVAGGLNLYRYTANSPPNLVDPAGLSPLSLLLRKAEKAALKAGEKLAKKITGGSADLEDLTNTYGDLEDIKDNIDTAFDIVDGDGLKPFQVGLDLALDLFGDAVAPGAPTNPYEPIKDLWNVYLPAYFPELGPDLSDLFDLDDPDPDLPPPPGDPLDDDSTDQLASFDPNDIIGPTGFGAQQFVAEGTPFLYTIHFENLAAATAPAQTVTVTQQLDPDFDFETFELMSFGLGASTVQIPAERSAFTARFDLDPLNLVLDVSAALNLETGLLTWTFTALDAATLEPPVDPLDGFLPPNQNAPEGEGFVTYLVRPKASLPTGTRLDAQARIVFDINAPIDTPAIFHTIDAGAPTSNVNALPATINSASFVLTWSRQDDAGGSGVVAYDVFVSDNGGAYALFRDDTLETSAVVRVRPGHEYSFYSIATDGVGHEQTAFTPVKTTVDGAAGSKHAFTDDDGDTYTLSLTGPGRMRFLPDDPDLNRKGPISLVVLEDTDPAKSRLGVRVRKSPTGDGRVSIGSIEGTGVKAITAPTSNLIGLGVDLTGPLGSLKIRDILAGAAVRAAGTAAQRTSVTAHVIGDGVTFNLGTAISAFTAAAVGDGSITAPSIGALMITGDRRHRTGGVPSPIRGDFRADLALAGTGDPKRPTALGSAVITGEVSGSAWDVAGDTGPITIRGPVTGWSLGVDGRLTSLTLGRAIGVTVSAGGSVRSVTATALSGTKILVGFTPDPTDPLGGVFSGNFRLGSLRVTGPDGFVNSVAAASSFESVSLRSVRPNNGDTTFGLVARTPATPKAPPAVGRLTVLDPALSLSAVRATPTLSAALDDFAVRVV